MGYRLGNFNFARNPWLPEQDPRIELPVDPNQIMGAASPDAFAGMRAATAVSPVAKGSGISDTRELKELAESDASDKNTMTVQKKLTQPEEEYLAQFDLASRIPQLAEQRANEAANKRLFQMQVMQPHQVDLANALSMAAHNINPNRYAVIPQQQYGMAEKEIREWAKQQQDDERDLARLAIAAKNSQSSGQLTQQIMQAMGVKGIQTATETQKSQDPNLSTKNSYDTNWRYWTKAFDNDIKEPQKALAEVDNLRAAINGTPAAQTGVPIQMARMLTGSARIAMAEVQMERGDPSFAAKMEQKWERLANGELTKENKEQYRAFISDIEKLHHEYIQLMGRKAIARGEPVNLSQADMIKYTQPKLNIPHYKPISTAPAKPKVDIQGMFKQLLEAEKNAK